ncbi:MAG: glycosyl-4,4'-diaponeurosporenoate acyltransferase [Oscillospiraceae bacterium]|nr:glycosyl-4,4'-diaponeurosporenoate acyltransferase [Oscillospiraceae bacterium]
MGFLKCFLYLSAAGALSFVLGRLLPKSWFNSEAFPYKSFTFEKEGRLYNKLNIKSWQNKLPDMSRVLPRTMPEKRVGLSADSAKLRVMLEETCVAEFIHVLLIAASFFCFRLWEGAGGAAVFAVYNLLGNLPFILMQRYNRPRLQKALRRCTQERGEKGETVTDAGFSFKLQHGRGA